MKDSCGSSPVLGAAWALTSPGPPWTPAIAWWPRRGTARKAAAALGAHDNLFTVNLDITDPTSVSGAVDAAVERLGRIDVLVNNAGTFQAGSFEEVSPEQFRAQMETNFFGPLNLTRAVLPIMRRQRSGHVITITSTAGVVSTTPFGTAYAASKFALEGWMEGLREELKPFGIKATAVEPGFFRTELLVEGASTFWPELVIDDYADTAETIEMWKSMNGKQAGDPAKLAASLIKVVQLDEAPARWVAGADAVEAITRKGQTLIDQAGPCSNSPPAWTLTNPPNRSRRASSNHANSTSQVHWDPNPASEGRV